MKQNLETNLNMSREKVRRMEDSFNFLTSICRVLSMCQKKTLDNYRIINVSENGNASHKK